MAELRGLGEAHKALAEIGGTVLAISVDPPEISKGVSQRYDLAFPILCDTERQVIKTYGLLHKIANPSGKDIAKPAQVLIERGGRIINRYLPDRVQDRRAPSEVLQLVRQLKS